MILQLAKISFTDDSVGIIQMSESATNNVQTILDYLNEDCWRVILDYVPVQDIIRTERTSPQWQDVVLTYLRSTGVRIGIIPYCLPIGVTKEQVGHNQITILDAHLKSFKNWTNKLGSLVMSAYCSNIRMLDIIRKNCPNIEAITFYNLRDVIDENGSFECLRRICFRSCYSILVEYCIGELLCSNTLEELEIVYAQDVSLKFLINTQWPKLKSIILKNCLVPQSLDNLLAATCLGQLTTLELHGAPEKVYEHINLLLDKMLKLEHLHIDGKNRSSSFFQYVSRLRYLNDLETGYMASDEDLEAITGQCLQLKILKLGRCDDVTWRGVAALCRNADARLTTLGLRESRYLMDDDVVAVVSSCPNLEVLDVRGCEMVTRAAVPRAAAARSALDLGCSPLHLVGDYAVTVLRPSEEYKELKLHTYIL